LNRRPPPRKGMDFDWYGFKAWLLKRYSRKYALNCFNYAKHYHEVLFDSDPEILTLSPFKQNLVLKALKALSIYLGDPALFYEFRRRHPLKWSRRDSTSIFKSLFNSRIDADELFNWLGRVKELGYKYYFPSALAFLLGLRAGEVFTMLHLIREKGLEGYYNPQTGALEHFRFSMFLRRTKNVYISFPPPLLLGKLRDFNEDITYNGFIKILRRLGLNSKLQEARKWYATILRDGGVSSEVVDLIQGRVPASVFLEYYYRPDFLTVKAKIFEILKPFESKLLD